MKTTNKKHYKTFIICALIVSLTLLTTAIFLTYRKVSIKRPAYYFSRIYSKYTTNATPIPYLGNIKFEPSTKVKDVHLIDIVTLDNHQMLSLETASDDSASHFVFCVSQYINKKSKKRTYNLPFPDRYSNKNERVMAYYGTFLKAYNNITFTFAHIPFIIVFSNNGSPIKIIKTKDNVPFPVIIQYKDYYLYKRGETFNSNIGAYVKNNFVYVFSSRVPFNTKHFIIDVYNLTTGAYINSIVADNKNTANNSDISRVYANKTSIYLKTKKGYYQIEN